MSTKVSKKEFSPLIVRKYNHLGVPTFVALITDDNVDDPPIDEVVVNFLKEFKNSELSLQQFRMIAGILTSRLVEVYKRSEGVAVVIFPDKAAVSSLWGDFMNHLHCRMELYAIINTMWML